MKCQTCATPLAGQPRVRLEWFGFETIRDGLDMWACRDHVRLVWPERDIALPESGQIVEVYQAEGEWLAQCRDHGAVAMKSERDDAELGAARHLARMHVEFVA